MSFNNRDLLLLFDRPKEPIFIPKGPKQTVFGVPPHYLTDKYRPFGSSVVNRFGDDGKEFIKVKAVATPQLGEILELKRDDNFSLFLAKHRNLAGKLLEIFIKAKNPEDLLSISLYARDRVNPYLFNYALSVALLHREDTQNLDLPSVLRFFPDKFIDSRAFANIREDSVVVPEDDRLPIEIPKDYTASDLEDEHRLAYFREDIGLNLHHWHWHLVYPIDGPREIVDKDRRGELFYYMHQQVLARYNFERLCNKLNRTQRLLDWKQPIKEGYFPKLNSLVASRPWPSRVANQTLADVRRDADEIIIDVDDLKRWADRIYDAIHSGFIVDARGNRMQLTEFEGINVLGNMVESSRFSPNRPFYGDLHNSGHVLLCYIHDPDQRHLESFGIMGDTSTAMRDPVFYRWHGYIDDIFQEHKNSLPRYTVDQLNYPGVTVTDVQVQIQGQQVNELLTFWQQSDVDLSRGMDFQPRGSVFVRFTHLQNRNFTYTVQVASNSSRQGTCRIFLAPKFDEKGNPWLFRDQKNMFIELDKFKVILKQGQNTITRSSTDSSVTIPFERTFRDLDTNRPTGGNDLAQFNFCGCGWPQNLLIPKGTSEGFQCQLFVMISNYADDVINEDISGQCNDADSYCGIKDKKYPDRRSMGYPFDRMPRNGVGTLQQFLTPNMRVQDVSIRFENRTFRPRN
ncbi:unnamed protein product [Ceutorhynchus assimilis]|uniref:Tyrosinase copper-binding domain-containing protein n=1 Tax=Ceutorhynchus assimilis TaxID=467358 RepID=A0A9N9ML78_9CUCU|nr:unnamed protein product [Ceutorhynchus assimilis]